MIPNFKLLHKGLNLFNLNDIEKSIIDNLFSEEIFIYFPDNEWESLENKLLFINFLNECRVPDLFYKWLNCKISEYLINCLDHEIESMLYFMIEDEIIYQNVDKKWKFKEEKYDIDYKY